MRVLALACLAACGRIGFDASAGSALIDDSVSADALPVPEGLVAYYPMEELVGGAVADATGNGHTATCAMMPPPQGQCPTVVAGRLGNALAFDGATQIMRVLSAPDLRTTAGFTVAAWVQIAAAPGGRACFTTKALGAVTYNSWAACIEPSRTVFFYTVSGASADNLFTVATVQPGTWHHVAVRWDGAMKTITLDGTDQISDSASTDFDDQPIYLGSDIDSGAFTASYAGLIDDLRIYNRALLPAELAVLAHP